MGILKIYPLVIQSSYGTWPLIVDFPVKKYCLSISMLECQRVNIKVAIWMWCPQNSQNV